MGKPLHFVLCRFHQKSGKIFRAKFETGGLDKSHKKSICIPGRNIRLYLYAAPILLHYIGRESKKMRANELLYPSRQRRRKFHAKNW